MAVIYCGDLNTTKPFGQRYDGGICATERKIFVLGDEMAHALKVGRGDVEQFAISAIR